MVIQSVYSYLNNHEPTSAAATTYSTVKKMLFRVTEVLW